MFVKEKTAGQKEVAMEDQQQKSTAVHRQRGRFQRLLVKRGLLSLQAHSSLQNGGICEVG